MGDVNKLKTDRQTHRVCNNTFIGGLRKCCTVSVLMDGKSLSSTTSLHMFSCTLIAAMLPDLQIDLNQRRISPTKTFLVSNFIDSCVKMLGLSNAS